MWTEGIYRDHDSIMARGREVDLDFALLQASAKEGKTSGSMVRGDDYEGFAIFGGPLGLMLNHYRAELRAKLTAQLPPKITTPRLFVAKYGSFSVIYGCYHYAKLKEARR